HVHAGGVVLHRLVDEALKAGEADDVVEAGGEVALREAEDGAVEEDVLPAGQLRMEPRPQLEQRRHLAAGPNATLVRAEDLGDAFQQPRLARTALADQDVLR